MLKSKKLPVPATDLLMASPVLGFPAPSKINIADWMMGHGFDPVNGVALAEQGFSPTNPVVNSTPQTVPDSQYNFVYDKNSLQVSLDFVQKAHGKGWGANVNEEIAAQFSSSFNSQRVSIYYYATTQESNEVIDKTTQKLSPLAKKILQEEGYEAFCNRYGTHFISGVVYGSGCYIAYHMEFTSASAQAAFQSSFSESYKGFGVNESMSEQINAAAVASKTNGQVDIKQSYYGFSPQQPCHNADDIARIQDEYQLELVNPDSPIEAQIVQVSVSPWDSLDEVYAIIQGDTISSLGVHSELGVVYNEVAYCHQSAMNFWKRKLFTGYSQFDLMNKFREDASIMLNEIIELVDEENNGTPIDPKVITEYYEKAAILSSRYETTANRFALSWYYYYPDGQGMTGILPNIDGSTPQPEFFANLNLWGVGGTTYCEWPTGDNTFSEIIIIDRTSNGENLKGSLLFNRMRVEGALNLGVDYRGYGATRGWDSQNVLDSMNDKQVKNLSATEKVTTNPTSETPEIQAMVI